MTLPLITWYWAGTDSDSLLESQTLACSLEVQLISAAVHVASGKPCLPAQPALAAQRAAGGLQGLLPATPGSPRMLNFH